MQKKEIILVLAFILLSTSSLADETYDIRIINQGSLTNNAIIQHSITFNESRSFVLDFGLPRDAKGVSLKVDGEFMEIDGADSYLIENGKEIVLEYVTEDIMNNNEILFSFDTLTKDDVYIKLTLEEGMYLRFESSDKQKLAIYPKDYTLSTDGQKIIILWHENNIEEFSGLVLIREKNSNTWIIAILTGLLIIILAVLFIFREDLLPKNKQKKIDHIIESIKKEIDQDLAKRKEEKKEPQEKPEKKSALTADIFDHLKEDEKQIIRILNQRDGSCEQATLRLVGNFSKATLSRILMELEERKVIVKENKGKKNIIHLRAR